MADITEKSIVNKSDLVKLVMDKTGHSKRDVADILTQIFETIKEQTQYGNNVRVYAFGVFAIKNIKTQKRFIVNQGHKITPGCKTVRFDIGKPFKKQLNL